MPASFEAKCGSVPPGCAEYAADQGARPPSVVSLSVADRSKRNVTGQLVARFVQFSNALSDTDSEWWPFRVLRCEPGKRMPLGRTMVLAVAYSLPAALFSVALGSLLGDRVEPTQLLMFLALTLVTVFFSLLFGVSFAWNRRAERVRRVRRPRRR